MYITIENSEKLRGLLKEIFTGDFMQEYTNFTSFEYFRYSSAVIVNWNAEKMIYDEDLLNLFVRESTRFRSFDEMVKTATDLRFGKEKEIT